MYVFYLIRKNNKGHIPNIVVIAIYVNRKKIKKVVDIIYSNDYYIKCQGDKGKRKLLAWHGNRPLDPDKTNETAKGGHHVRLLFHRRSRGQQIQSC